LYLDVSSGKVVDANKAAEDFWGHPIMDLIGSDYNELFDAAGLSAFESAAKSAGGMPFELKSIKIVQQSTATHSAGMRANSPGTAHPGLWICAFSDHGRSSVPHELRRLNWALSACAKSSSALISSAGMEPVMARICEAIVEQGVYVLAAVALAQEAPEKWLNFVAAAGPAIGYLDNLKISPSAKRAEGLGATGRALRSGVPQVVRDTKTESDYTPWRENALSFGLRSSVSVPFRKNNDIVGALLVYASEPDAFGPRELNVFQQLARDIAFAMTLDEDRLRLQASETAQRLAEERVLEAQAKLLRVSRISLMGEFSAAIAHEINQPLAAIEINGDAALHWLDRPHPEIGEARGAIARIMRDAKRANEVIKRTRAMHTSGERDYRAIDLNETLEEVLAMTLARRQKSAIALDIETSPDLKPVWGDRIQVQQVIFNLILNAFEAMEAVDDRPRRLRVATRAFDPTQALVEIEDSGRGIDSAASAPLFERFFTTKSGGTGLGLAISRSIVEAHGGRIWASRALAGGASFSFTIPFVLERLS
jgi:signal transduction histidine kinase